VFVFDLLFLFYAFLIFCTHVNFDAMYMHCVLEYSCHYNSVWLTVHEVFTVGLGLKFSPAPNR